VLQQLNQRTAVTLKSQPVVLALITQGIIKLASVLAMFHPTDYAQCPGLETAGRVSSPCILEVPAVLWHVLHSDSPDVRRLDSHGKLEDLVDGAFDVQPAERAEIREDRSAAVIFADLSREIDQRRQCCEITKEVQSARRATVKADIGAAGGSGTMCAGTRGAEASSSAFRGGSVGRHTLGRADAAGQSCRAA